MKKIMLLFCIGLQTAYGQTADSINTRIAKIDGNLYFIDCVNGFGGGNITASIGEDGILLADDMYAVMTAKLRASLATISTRPVRMVLNSHFHGDHIQGNLNFQKTSVIIAHENVSKRLARSESAGAKDLLPAVTFSDSLTLHFNGEDIKMIHFPNSHTDGDAAIYFTRSKVLHLGDMFFFGMFPAVYTEGGGNIKQLVISLDKILQQFPSDAHVVPGHGDLATMKDLAEYTAMLKETIGIVETNLRNGKTLDQMKTAKVLAKYDALGAGGAQTTDQYLAMLYKLLTEKK
jgi:cyclase